MLGVAFKEWAAVCRALADGRQAVILRKGGIAEEGGAFRPEHARFWLYPTYFHAQQAGVKPESADLLAAAERDRPPEGTLRLTHWVEVPDVALVRDLQTALALDPFHVWTADTVRQRFQYRSPGLYVLPVRVYRALTPVEVPESPGYAGCKTWVTLDAAVREYPAAPVTPDKEWGHTFRRLAEVLYG
jgi:hypothetical protein